MEMAPYIPVLIFLARICDVSIGTMRMILVISGARYSAAALGFVEVTIWALAVGGMIKYLENPFAVIAYAAGFAAGTLAGVSIEGRIALGYRVVRVINADMSRDVSARLREEGALRVTRIDGAGKEGPVEIAFLVVKRRDLTRALSIIEQIAPDAFVSVERTDHAAGEAFGFETGASRRGFFGRFGGLRK